MATLQIGRYTIVEEIGQGGMGTVYRGVDQQSGRPVAVKELRRDIVDAERVERFKREGEILRRLNHPNIVQLLDAVESDGQHYLIMECIEAGSLRDKLDRAQRLDIQEIVSLAIEIADALTRAHHLKVIHRDIKPANVLIAADGTPRLADFGIARISESNATMTGMIVGTMHYISPEVLQGKSADRTSDIWSFGVMLFEMLTGSVPFKRGEHPAVTIHSILHDPVPDIETLRPDAPVALIDLIYRMLAKEPSERIPSFRAVGAELESIQQGKERIATKAAAFRRDTSDSLQTTDNLPAQTTPFLGRAAEIAAVRQLLDNPQNRLITILAQGGMGKTRLALEVARQSRTHFSQGVTFVPLARIESAEYLAQTIAEELNLALTSQEDPNAQLLNYLKSVELFLLLDNFEHVLQGAALVQQILESAPGVTILATSRERLNLGSEIPFNLPSMKVADWKTVEEAMTYSAAQLFVNGARRARADFVLQPEDISGLARICRLADGLPLAILLAATWADTLGVNEIAAEIERNIDFLESELRDIPDRQRSMRSVLESTWRLLDPQDQELFAQLSIFRSSFNRDAAENIAGASLRGLAKLIAKSLLTRDAESGRYHIHELLRQYSQSQLEKSPESYDKVCEAHAHYFADFMKERWTHLKDHRSKQAVQEIQDDIENVRAAWRYWVGQCNCAELRKFFESLWAVYEIRSWFRSGVDLFHEAGESLERDQSESSEMQITRAYLLALEGWFTSLLGLPHVGIEMARKSFAIFGNAGGAYDVFLPCSAVGINGVFLNLIDEVEASANRLSTYAEEHGDLWMRGFGKIWLAFVAVARGKFEQAQKTAQDAVAIFEKLRNPFGLSVSSAIILGAAFMAQGKLAEAKDAYQRGLDAAKSIDYRRLVQLCYDSLGSIALLEANLQEAYSYFLNSLRITFESGQTREQLGSLRDIATVLKSRGSLDQALELLAVVLQHPASIQNSLSRRESLKDEAERLRVEIETTLPADRYSTAWNRGLCSNLDAVITALLKQNQDAPTLATDSGI